jgi:hypothetical protein
VLFHHDSSAAPQAVQTVQTVQTVQARYPYAVPMAN